MPAGTIRWLEWWGVRASDTLPRALRLLGVVASGLAVAYLAVCVASVVVALVHHQRFAGMLRFGFTPDAATAVLQGLRLDQVLSLARTLLLLGVLIASAALVVVARRAVASRRPDDRPLRHWSVYVLFASILVTPAANEAAFCISVGATRGWSILDRIPTLFRRRASTRRRAGPPVVESSAAVHRLAKARLAPRDLGEVRSARVAEELTWGLGRSLPDPYLWQTRRWGQRL